MLPNPSSEQLKIIESISKKNNLVVDSVAGSGKTTTNLYISKFLNEKNILLLTYNSKLKLETREKVRKYDINNLEVHSYHSFCVKYYYSQCFTDKILKKVLDDNLESKKKFSYDIIICDEAQDITPLYFKLIKKIYKDNIEKLGEKTTQLVLLGDVKQSIYKFNKADERFIVYAPQIFNLNNLPWNNKKLNISYRITKEMSEFVNNCMLGKEFIISNKKTGIKPKYIICDTFGTPYGNPINLISFKIVKQYLDNGYQANDIFILCPSLKSDKSPVRVLENKLKMEIPDLPIYVPVSDEEKLDDSILEDKLVFSTFHQVKGLERKVVLVFSFDNTYNMYYNRDNPEHICANEMYVACTRASEHLIMFHQNGNDYLGFLNKAKLEKYADVIKMGSASTSSKFMNRNVETKVTDLIKHLPQDVLTEAMKFIDITTIRKKGEYIDIPQKTKQGKLSESVSEINGVAIPLFYELQMKGYISILKKLTSNENETEYNTMSVISNNMRQKNMFSFLKVDKKVEEKINEKEVKKKELKNKKYNIDKINVKKLTPDELLYISNRWCAYKSGYIFKVKQIKTYDWLIEEDLKKSIDRIKSLNISTKTEFEKLYILENKKELYNRKIIGYVDCYDKINEKMYEFKCVKKLKDEYYLQLAVYAYLNENYKEEERNSIDLRDILLMGNNIIDKFKEKTDKKEEKETEYYLYNILTDELKEIKFKMEDLREMMKYLIEEKYFKKYEISDTEFIKNMIEI